MATRSFRWLDLAAVAAALAKAIRKAYELRAAPGAAAPVGAAYQLA